MCVCRGPSPLCDRRVDSRLADLVAAILVQHNQEDGHDHDDADHDDGVEDGVEKPATDRLGVLCEWRVDPVGTNTR